MSNWDPDALKEYLDSHIAAIHAEILSRVTELHREHDKFEETVREGFVKQNEFRGSLEDLGKAMATRREVETLEASLNSRRETVESSLNTRMLNLGEAINSRFLRVENNQARIAGGLFIVGVVFPLAAALIFHLIA